MMRLLFKAGRSRACYVAILACLLLIGDFASVPVLAQSLRLGGEFVTTVNIMEVTESWDVLPQSLLRLKLKAGDFSWKLYADVSGRLYQKFPGAQWESDVELERLYGKLYFPDFDLSIGKQEISWGVGYAWAPTDLFNPPNPLDPEGRRQGVNAVVARIPAGPLDYWSAVAAYRAANALVEDDGEWRFGLRRHGNTNGTDWSFLAIRGEGVTTLGADFKGDLGLGWSGEAAYFLPDNGDSRWEAVIGADYSWFDGRLIWRGEYFYSSDGAVRMEDYDYLSLLGGQTKYLARHYAFNSLTGQIDQFTSVTGAVLTNLVDRSAAWTLGAGMHLTGDWQLNLALTAFTGEPGGEYAGGVVPGTPITKPDYAIKAQLTYIF